MGDACDLDDDNDQFSDVVESAAGTNPLDNCVGSPGTGGDAWPADINQDTFVDVIGDISQVAGQFGNSVPPAPARYDIAPNPPDHFIDVIGDISRLAGLFGQHCTYDCLLLTTLPFTPGRAPPDFSKPPVTG